MHNPTGDQMPYSELKFMQWVINAIQYTHLRCKLVSSLLMYIGIDILEWSLFFFFHTNFLEFGFTAANAPIDD